MLQFGVGEAKLELARGDVSEADTRAIANAANAMLIAGGGVDGAIHRAAGPELQAALREKKLELPGGLLQTGQAVLTPGYRLRAAYVIHCVGPIYMREGDRAAALLADCYSNALALCAAHAIESITFPSISTGAYGYPVEEAAHVAVKTVIERLQQSETPRLCRFMLFDDPTFAAYEQAVQALLKPRR